MTGLCSAHRRIVFVRICVEQNIQFFATNLSQRSVESLFLHDKHQRLNNIHSNLKLEFGSFRDEYPEQLMSVRYLKGHEKVLEIGGNIGRNSLIIASIINNNNFVSLECDTEISKQLIENRDLNNFTFFVENSALSKRKLIQKGWDTKPSEVLEDGYKEVNTISYDELMKRKGKFYKEVIVNQ
jgi:FkbM family methyltransferase